VVVTVNNFGLATRGLQCDIKEIRPLLSWNCPLRFRNFSLWNWNKTYWLCWNVWRVSSGFLLLEWGRERKFREDGGLLTLCLQKTWINATSQNSTGGRPSGSPSATHDQLPLCLSWAKVFFSHRLLHPD
jgi:hypothetical protein